jgi:sorbitol-specific phosphotransferase system component IIBC
MWRVNLLILAGNLEEVRILKQVGNASGMFVASYYQSNRRAIENTMSILSQLIFASVAVVSFALMILLLWRTKNC